MKKLSLQLTVTIVLLGLLLTGSFFYSYINFRNETNRMKESMHEKVKSAYDLFSYLIEDEKDGLAKALTVLTRMDVLPSHLFKKDKENLMALSLPFFKELKKDFRITHLYFIEPSGAVLLRVHKPEQSGDILNRITYNEAKKTGKMATGIEMGKNFFSLRAIRPVDYQGQFAGYIEIGMEIDHVFAKIKKMTRSDMSLFLSKAFIKSKDVRIPGKMIQGFGLLESTAKNTAEEIISEIKHPEQGLKEFVSVELRHGAKHILAGITPFKDAAGVTSGILMVCHDVTGMISDSIRTFRKNTVIFLVVILMFFLAALSVLGKIMKYRISMPIARIIEGLVSTSHQVSGASSHLSSASIYLTQEIIKMTDSIRTIYAFSNQIAEMTVQNADTACQSDKLMKDTAGVAEEAKKYIDDLMDSIHEISKSGHETEGIVKTIDEVASDPAACTQRRGRSGKGRRSRRWICRCFRRGEKLIPKGLGCCAKHGRSDQKHASKHQVR